MHTSIAQEIKWIHEYATTKLYKIQNDKEFLEEECSRQKKEQKKSAQNSSKLKKEVEELVSRNNLLKQEVERTQQQVLKLQKEVEEVYNALLEAQIDEYVSPEGKFINLGKVI